VRRRCARGERSRPSRSRRDGFVDGYGEAVRKGDRIVAVEQDERLTCELEA
jgi:hypothetical protein